MKLGLKTGLLVLRDRVLIGGGMGFLAFDAEGGEVACEGAL